MTTATRILVLTEDSGKQAQSTIQALTKAAIALVAPRGDRRLFELRPPPEKDSLVSALRANGWKTKRPTPEKIRLLAEIANSLIDGFVVFHVDTDRAWPKRAQSDNRSSFDEIIRKGVSSVLQGFAPNPIGRNAPKKTAAEAEQLLRRLFVMHPCYSVESWLYQATAKVVEICRATHSHPAHQTQIATWALDRTLLDELERPKDDVLRECVGDQHNGALAPAFPAAEVHAANRSWTEFVDQLADCNDLISRLGPVA